MQHFLSKLKLFFKDLTNGRVGTWVKEEVSNYQSNNIAFMNEGSAVSTSDNFGLAFPIPISRRSLADPDRCLILVFFKAVKFLSLNRIRRTT